MYVCDQCMLHLKKKICFLCVAAGSSFVVKEDTFKIVLADIVSFTTGIPVEHPLGFSLSPSINFNNAKFPTANTCANILYLPLQHTCFSEFAWHMLCDFEFCWFWENLSLY